MHVVFRVDASLTMGTGHLMRCLALADALREKGATCRFICRAHPGHLNELIQQRGFVVHALPVESGSEEAADDLSLPVHAAWLGVGWERDAHQTQSVLGGDPVDWLVIDHYAIDERWERKLKSHCRQLLVIDDLADRAHECNVLLDQNLGRAASDYAQLVPLGCRLLVGPTYALLRPEFAAVRLYSLERRQAPKLQHLFITMGGVDAANATGSVLNVLQHCSLPPDCRITVVLGAHAPWRGTVQAQAVLMRWPTDVKVNVQNMAQLMADCDLAIGAAGSTSWERCCLGVPAILVALAANQEAALAALERAGAAHAVLLSELPDKLPLHLLELSDQSRLKNFIDAAAGVTDGLGCLRVCQAIGETSNHAA